MKSQQYTVADLNVERLIGASYSPELPDIAFMQNVEEKLLFTACQLAESRRDRSPTPSRQPAPLATIRRRLCWAVSVAAALMVGFLAWYAHVRLGATPANPTSLPDAAQANVDPGSPASFGLTPRPRPATEQAKPIAVGQTLATKAGERRRATLIDGSVVYLNQNSEIKQLAPRRLQLLRGEVYLEVAPSVAFEEWTMPASFVVITPGREVSALGTRFAVEAERNDTGVLVTQGKVKVSGIQQAVETGQQLPRGGQEVVAAPRASHQLDWTRELMAAAESPLVPAGNHAGGGLVAVDPQGQEIRLTLRKYLVDVHIEDGFARTTIDQTYFNNEHTRLEGTFYFPLPPDATLSRLAMYVEDGSSCKLNEGGMAERDLARQVYETIRYTNRDPALLEWVDGSTFKMRVFPLEGRKEKRIILSYTQRLSGLYGTAKYRFPSGHNMNQVQQWTFQANIKHGAKYRVTSDSHPAMKITPRGPDMLAQLSAKNVRLDQDVSLDVAADSQAQRPRFSSFIHESHQYVMLRFSPEMTNEPKRQRRDWVFLFESGANRDPLLARAQIEVIRALLQNVEHDDTFSILTAGSRVQLFDKEPRRPTRQNIDDAAKFLDTAHLIGALDLEQALRTAAPLLAKAKNPHLVHVGAGIPAMGERRDDALVKLLGESVRYVGIGVGKRWNRAFMKAAAERTQGCFTQINPDETISWRAFDLLATLNTPRLLDVRVVDPAKRVTFLTEATSLSQGEELFAVARIGNDSTMPAKVVVTGRLGGKPFTQELALAKVTPNAGYLPRQWAKLEIDRLLAEDSDKNKAAIVELSKASYVMSPFTSLLVLETEADYARFKVDRGRKDHWALYDCPKNIPIVYEPVAIREQQRTEPNGKPKPEEVLQTILVRVPPRIVTTSEQPGYAPRATSAWGSYGIVDDFMLTFSGGNLASQSGRARKTSLSPTNVIAQNQLGSGTSLVHSAPGKVNDWTAGLMLNTPLGFRQEHLGMPPEEQRYSTPSWPENILAGDKINKANDPFDGMPGSGDWNNSRLKYKNPVRQRYSVTFREPFLFDPPVTNSSTQRIQFAPVFVTPKMQWAVPNAPLPPPNPLYSTRFYLGVEQPPLARLAIPPVPVIDIMAQYEMQNEFARPVSLRLSTPMLTPDQLAELANSNRRQFQTKRDDLSINGNRFPESLGLSGTLLPGTGLKIGTANLARANIFGSLDTLGNPNDPLYRRPILSVDQRLFNDLPLHAPGLNTNDTDILAVLANESSLAGSGPIGKIEPAARKLIDKARALDWSSLTIEDTTFHFNGAGQYAFRRTLPSGLGEQVICDGKKLVHLYPEIGLGAKRTVSRFHRAELAQLVPWHVLSAEDLAHGADVKWVDERTIALVPQDSLQGGVRGGGNATNATWQVHLVFAKDGRLSERQLIEMPTSKVLYRETYGADGTIQCHGKETVTQKLKLAKAEPPNLKPDTSKLVVVPMPLRTREHLFKSAIDSYAQLDADQVVSLIAAYCLEDQGSKALQAFGERLHVKGDRRIGFYTLLATAQNFDPPAYGPGPPPPPPAFGPPSSFPAPYGPPPYPSVYPQASQLPGTQFDTTYVWGQVTTKFNILAEHPQDPLASYLAHINKALQKSYRLEPMRLTGPKNSFLTRQAEFHDQYKQMAVACEGPPSMPRHQAQCREALTYIQRCPSAVHAWIMLEHLQRFGRIDSVEFERTLADLGKRFGDTLSLADTLRYEQARTELRTGRREQARQAFADLYAETLKAGVLPRIDADFVQAFRDAPAGHDFAALVRQTSVNFAKDNWQHANMLFAWQLWQLGETTLAAEVFGKAMPSDPVKHLDLALAGIDYLWQTKQFAGAEQVLDKLLTDAELAQQPAFWRLGAVLAQKRGAMPRTIVCQEKALELEFQHLPESVDLEVVRKEFGDLLRNFEQLAQALATLSTPPPADLVPRVIRAADRWRLLDPEQAAICGQTARILKKLGARELAWDYLTTPIGLSPNESSPWLALAGTLVGDGELEQADRAYVEAFAAEPTNPQILWDRAQNLLQLSRVAQARQLYRQIGGGTWQPRFQSIQDQSRLQLHAN